MSKDRSKFYNKMSWRDINVEEEEALLEDGSPEAVMELLDRHLPQIMKIATAYSNKYQGDKDTMYDELVQVGFVGAEKHISKYKPEKGSITTQIYWGVRSAISYYLDTEINVVRIPRVVDPVKGYAVGQQSSYSRLSLGNTISDGDSVTTLQDKLPCTRMTSDELLMLKDLSITVGDAIASLKPYFQLVIKEYYINGKTIKEIGNSVGKTHQAISLTLKDAKQALRHYFLRQGCESLIDLFKQEGADTLEDFLEESHEDYDT